MVPLRELLWMSDEELGRIPIELVHLSCAEDLPRSDRIDVERCLDFIARAAFLVERETARHWYRFVQDPGKCNHSEAEFRCRWLVSVLWQNMGVRYNPAKADWRVPLDMHDTFIHGAIYGDGGTCASLPVLYAAVGRRLRYPIKLVSALVKKHQCGHCFCRWDDPGGERMNFDVNHTGMSNGPDDKYRTGVYETTPEEERLGCFLTSHTPREDLAGFMAERGMCWLDAGNWRQAANSFAWSHGLAPANKFKFNRLLKTLREWLDNLRRDQPPQFPAVQITAVKRRFPTSVGLDVELDILRLEIVENLLRDPEAIERWWTPLRHGIANVRPPTWVHGSMRDDGCTIKLNFSPLPRWCLERREKQHVR